MKYRLLPYMKPSRCLALALAFALPISVHAQSRNDHFAPANVETRFPGDERQAKLAERYRAMLAANPSEGVALDRLWKLWDEQHATRTLIDSFASESTRVASVSSWLIYGHLLKRAGRLDEAAKAYDQAALADPAGYLPCVARGEIALARQEPSVAAPLLAEAAGKLPPGDPRRADLRTKLGTAWIASGQPEKAIENWDAVVLENPANLGLRRQIAETFARNHLTDHALFHYEYVAAHDTPPQQAMALREIGRMRESRGEFDRARDAFERALKLTSRDNWLHDELLTAIIRLYERAGRGTELAERWRHDNAQSPRDLDGLLRLEKLAETQGDVPGQREWLEKIGALIPRDRDSRLKLARLLANTGERNKAEAAYDVLLVDQPRQLDLLISRADLDVQAGHLDDATKRLEDRLVATPDDETISTPILEYFLGHHLDAPAERLLQRLASQHPKAVEPAIALAKFYLAHRRTGEARTILDRLPDQSQTNDERIECWKRVAAIYRDADLQDDALDVWRQVENALPTSPAPKLAIAEILLAGGEVEKAAEALEQSADLLPEGAERETVEHRLFEVLSAAKENTNPRATGLATIDLSQRTFLRLTPPDKGAVPTAPVGKSPLAQYLAKLDATAKHNPMPPDLLRLARWQTWANAPLEAVDTLEKMVAGDPANVPARRQLVELALAAKEYDLVQRHLRELLRLDPDRKTTYLSRLANNQLEQGDSEAALSVYGELVQAQPGSADALSDLALAQQRVERWLDAVATWKRAYALPMLTPSQRGNLLRPLVAAYEHLTEYKAGAELLLAACDAQSNVNSRLELVRDLSEFCRRHGLSDWLEETLERRRVAQPDDYPSLMALAEQRKAQGKLFDACEILARAYYSAPDPVAALKALAEAAESAGENERAVWAWRRLLSLPGQNTPANLQRLATLEEDDLNEEAATHTWDAIIARFPRDVVTLVLASEFFERTGQIKRACRHLGDAVALDASDLDRMFHLAELERDSGDPTNAGSHFERLLADSMAAKQNGAYELPDDLRFPVTPMTVEREPATMSTVGSAKPGRPDRNLRLRAIRELAHLLPPANTTPAELSAAGLSARQVWLQRWRRAAELGARDEPLMALYESGESTAVMELLEQWMSEMPADDRLRSAYLQAGLSLRQYRRLARWAWPEDDVERQFSRGSLLIEAIQAFLARDGEPNETIAAELFPDYLRARNLLWRAANGFAERQWYRQAAQLGERVSKLTGNENALYSSGTARWMLLLGEIERARTFLADVVAKTELSYNGSGASPSLEVLRVYFALLPKSEQAAFIDARLRACRERGMHSAELLTGIFLHGLRGDEAEAVTALDALLDQSLLGAETDESADVRHWIYVLSFGNQLQAWRLEKMAVHLWWRALQRMSAFDRANGALQSTLSDIRSRLLVLEVKASDNPEQTREKVASFLRRPPNGMVAATASQLLVLRQLPAARQLYEFLVRTEPNDGDHWRNYLSICEALSDGDAAERTLQAMLDNPDTLPPAVSRAQVVRLLATWRRKDGDAAGAIRLLERECQESAGSSTLLTALAYAYENAGLYDEAARVWQLGAATDSGNARNYRLASARLEEVRGHLPQAIDILQREQAANPSIVTGEGPLRLASLYLKSGQSVGARLLAERALDAQEFQTLLEIARMFTQAKQPGPGLELLALGVKRCREPGLRFRFQQQWLQIKERPPGESPTDYLRGLRRLRQIALSAPALRQSYLGPLYQIAREHGADAWLETELKREWHDGIGNPAAGLQLVKFYAETRQREALQQVAETARKSSGASDDLLTGIAEQLAKDGCSAIALPIYEQLVRRYPQNEAHTLGLANTLEKTGRGEAAAQILETLDRASVIRGDSSIQIADAFERLGKPDRATELLRRAVEADPDASGFPEVYSRLAEYAAKQGNWSEARRLLSTLARRSAGMKDLQPLANCLFDSGEIGDVATLGMPGRDLPLTFRQRADFLALIYQRLKNNGRLADARAVAAISTNFLSGSSLLTAEMLADSDLGHMPALAESLERACNQSDHALPYTTRTLAAFYVRWASLETNDEQSGLRRAAHLTRANQLTPSDFEIARQLASLRWEQGNANGAAEVLQPFLKPEAVPTEREQARQLLAKH